MCQNCEVARLLSAHIAEIGAYCLNPEPIVYLDSGAKNLFSAISALNCVKMRSPS